MPLFDAPLPGGHTDGEPGHPEAHDEYDHRINTLSVLHGGMHHVDHYGGDVQAAIDDAIIDGGFVQLGLGPYALGGTGLVWNAAGESSTPDIRGIMTGQQAPVTQITADTNITALTIKNTGAKDMTARLEYFSIQGSENGVRFITDLKPFRGVIVQHLRCYGYYGKGIWIDADIYDGWFLKPYCVAQPNYALQNSGVHIGEESNGILIDQPHCRNNSLGGIVLDAKDRAAMGQVHILTPMCEGNLGPAILMYRSGAGGAPVFTDIRVVGGYFETNGTDPASGHPDITVHGYLQHSTIVANSWSTNASPAQEAYTLGRQPGPWSIQVDNGTQGTVLFPNVAAGRSVWADGQKIMDQTDYSTALALNGDILSYNKNRGLILIDRAAAPAPTAGHRFRLYMQNGSLLVEDLDA